MAESLTIDRNNRLPDALDYNFLRKEGLQLIEHLSGKVWTDYNTHDPGITLLEAMCYALTDLGYRTSFKMEDLLAPAGKVSADTWKHLFYTARQILPCNPLTLIDYRKLIIDTEGVRNAWIETSDEYEILLYLQKTQKTPPAKPPYSLTYDFRKGEDVLHLRGLYKVFVEYEDTVLEDGKENEVADVIRKKLQFHRNLTEDFVSVSPVEYENFPVEAIIQVSEGTDVEMINAKIYKVIHDFFSPPVNFYSLEEMLEKNLSSEDIFEGPILNYGFINTAELVQSDRFKNIHLSDIIHLISGIEGIIAVKKFSFLVAEQDAFSNFTEWINNVKDKQKTPRLDIDHSTISFQRSGDRHRDANEKQVDKERVNGIFSFLKSDNLKTRLRGSGKDIAVPAGEFMDVADYYPFQKNLPSAYDMMETLIDGNDRVDRLAITTAAGELLGEKIGLQGARVIDFLLSNKKDRDRLVRIADQLIAGPADNAYAVIDIVDKELEEDAGEKMLKKMLHELAGSNPAGAAAERRLLYHYIEADPLYTSASYKALVLQQLSTGKLKKTLHQVTSNEEIAKLDTLYRKHQVDQLEKRKKMVLQLRGFLMVFEQIMADHLSQLAHTRDIFSFGDTVKQNAYPQIISDINDMEALFIDFKQYSDFHLKMIETPEAFTARRNTVLDHLLSRFSESMAKYGFFMQQYEGKQAGKRLISDKISFLADYVQISSYRGKGYNYSDPENTWDSNNVEGIKKRICRLLGISNYNRQKIAPDSIFIRKTELEKGVDRFVVMLADPEDRSVILLTGKEDYQFESEALIILTYILEHGNEPALYTKEGHGENWRFELKRLTPENVYEPVAFSRHFSSGTERDEALEKTLRVLGGFTNDENFHVLEHILLRPKAGPAEKEGSAADILLLPVEDIPGEISDAEVQKDEAPYKFKIMHTKDQKNKNRNVWKLGLMKNNADFLTVREDFIFYKHLTRRMEHIRKFAADRMSYKTATTIDGYYTFKITDGQTVIAESKKNYRKEEDFEDEISSLVTFLSFGQEFLTGAETENTSSYYADPYSFQISIILPSWQRRFRDSTFKHLIEKTIYLETPSHIYPHVYWADHQEMKTFDRAYELWVNEVATNEIPAADIVNDLVKALIKLRK